MWGERGEKMAGGGCCSLYNNEYNEQSAKTSVLLHFGKDFEQ
jgi:hypothetical protein